MAEFNAEQLRKYIEKIVTQELDKTQKFENFLTGQILDINSGVYDIQLSGENETPIKAVSINDKRYSIEDDVYVIKATTGLSTSYLILDRIVDLQEEFANLTLAERFVANNSNDGALEFEDLQSPRYLPRRDPDASEKDKEKDRNLLSIIAANGAFKVSAIFSSAANGDGTVKEIKGGLSITLSHYDEETEEEQILKTYYLIADDLRGQPEAMYSLEQEKIFLIDDENIKSYFNQITFEKVGDEKTFTCSDINLVSGSLIDVDAVIQVKTEIENGKNYFSKEVPSGYEDKIKLSAAVYYDGQQLVQDNQVQYYWLVKNTNIDLNKIQVFRREWDDSTGTAEDSLDAEKEYTTNYSYYYDNNLKQYILNAGDEDEYQYIGDVEFEGKIVEKWKREEVNKGSKYLYTSFIHRYLPDKEKELSLIGEGWSCLNSYEEVPLIALEEYATVPDKTIRLWDSNNNTITLTSTAYQKYFYNYENTVKCLIRCGDNIVSSDEFIIYNHANESFSAKMICEEPAEILFEKTNFALTCDVINSNKKIKEADYTFEYKWFRWAEKEEGIFEWTEIVDVPITAETIYLYDREFSEVTDKDEAKLYVQMQPNDEGKESIKCQVTVKKNDTDAFVSIEEAEKTVLSRVSLDVEITAREYYKYYLSKNSFVQFEQAVNENETEWNGDWDIYDPAGSKTSKAWQTKDGLSHEDVFEKFDIFTDFYGANKIGSASGDYVYFTKQTQWIQKPKRGIEEQAIVVKIENWTFPIIARQVGYVNEHLVNIKNGYSIDQLNTFNQLTYGGETQGIFYAEMAQEVDKSLPPDPDKKYYKRTVDKDSQPIYTLLSLSTVWKFTKGKTYYTYDSIQKRYAEVNINLNPFLTDDEIYYEKVEEVSDSGDIVEIYKSLARNKVNFTVESTDWPRDKDGFLPTEPIYTDVGEKLFINADYIQTGTLRVGDRGSERFYASIDDDYVKIGGFMVDEDSLSSGMVPSEDNPNSPYVYLGTDGIQIGNGLIARYGDGKFAMSLAGDVTISGGLDGNTDATLAEMGRRQLYYLYSKSDTAPAVPQKDDYKDEDGKRFPDTHETKWHTNFCPGEDKWKIQKIDLSYYGAVAWGTPFPIRGLDGVSIEGITEWYVANDRTSWSQDDQKKEPDIWNWQTTIPTLSLEKAYLWNYEVIYDSNEIEINRTAPIIIAYYTEDGFSIDKITNYYALSDNENSHPTYGGQGYSATNPDPDTWSTATKVPTEQAPYLWNYEVITYKKDHGAATKDPTWTTPAVIGMYGVQGASLQVLYAKVVKGNAATLTTPDKDYSQFSSASDGTGYAVWVTTEPSLAAGDVLYMSQKMSNETADQWSTPIPISGTDGATKYELAVDDDFISVPVSPDGTTYIDGTAFSATNNTLTDRFGFSPRVSLYHGDEKKMMVQLLYSSYIYIQKEHCTCGDVSYNNGDLVLSKIAFNSSDKDRATITISYHNAPVSDSTSPANFIKSKLAEVTIEIIKQYAGSDGSYVYAAASTELFTGRSTGFSPTSAEIKVYKKVGQGAATVVENDDLFWKVEAGQCYLNNSSTVSTATTNTTVSGDLLTVAPAGNDPFTIAVYPSSSDITPIDKITFNVVKDGDRGADGADIKFIYLLSSESDSSKLTALPGKNDDIPKPSDEDSGPDRWYDSPQGVTPTHQYEYVSVKTKSAGINSDWSVYSYPPALWSKWGAEGRDGDGVEYLFRAYSDPQSFGDSFDPYKADGTTEWQDDPPSVTETDKYIYVTVGRYSWETIEGGDKVKKTDWSTPVIWTRYVEDGKSLSSIIEYYAWSDKSEGLVVGDISDWSEGVVPSRPTDLEGYIYLWNYEESFVGNTSIATTAPVLVYTQEAVVTNVQKYYAITDTGETTDSTIWKEYTSEGEISGVEAGDFLWLKVVTTYSNGKSNIEISSSRIANDGTSVFVRSTSSTYAWSNDGKKYPSDWSSWEELPDPSEGQSYLWTKTETTFSEGPTATSYSVAYQGSDGDSFGGIEDYYTYTSTSVAPENSIQIKKDGTLDLREGIWSDTDVGFDYPNRIFKWGCEAVKGKDSSGNAFYVNITTIQFLGEMPKQKFEYYTRNANAPVPRPGTMPGSSWSASVPSGSGTVWAICKTDYAPNGTKSWGTKYQYSADAVAIKETVDLYCENYSKTDAPDSNDFNWAREAKVFSEWTGWSGFSAGSVPTYVWKMQRIIFEDNSYADGEITRLDDLTAITLAAKYQIKDTRFVIDFHLKNDEQKKYLFPIFSLPEINNSASLTIYSRVSIDSSGDDYLVRLPEGTTVIRRDEETMSLYLENEYEDSVDYYDYIGTQNNRNMWRQRGYNTTLYTSMVVQNSAASLITSDNICGKDFQTCVPEGDIGRWCQLYNKTVISGGAILTGSVTADKIKTNSLSAIAADLGEITTGLIKSKDYQEKIITSSQRIDNAVETVQVESGWHSVMSQGWVDLSTYKNRFVGPMGEYAAGSYVVHDYFVDEIQFKFTPTPAKGEYGRTVDSISGISISYISYGNQQVSNKEINTTGQILQNKGPLGSDGPIQTIITPQGDDIIIKIKYYTAGLQALYLSQDEANYYNQWGYEEYRSILPNQVAIKIAYAYHPQFVTTEAGAIISFEDSQQPYIVFPNFQVTPNGSINATAGTIGGFHIASDHLADGIYNNENTDNHLVMLSPGLRKTEGDEAGYVFWAGRRTLGGDDSSRPFWIKSDGSFHSAKGTIGNVSIENDGLKIYDNNKNLAVSFSKNGILLSESVATLQIGGAYFKSDSDGDYLYTNRKFILSSNNQTTFLALSDSGGKEDTYYTVTINGGKVRESPTIFHYDGGSMALKLTSDTVLLSDTIFTIYFVYKTTPNEVLREIRTANITIKAGAKESDFYYIGASNFDPGINNKGCYIKVGFSYESVKGELSDKDLKYPPIKDAGTGKNYATMRVSKEFKQVESTNNIILKGNLLPESHESYNLGDAEKSWNVIYVKSINGVAWSTIKDKLKIN